MPSSSQRTYRYGRWHRRVCRSSGDCRAISPRSPRVPGSIRKVVLETAVDYRRISIDSPYAQELTNFLVNRALVGIRDQFSATFDADCNTTNCPADHHSLDQPVALSNQALGGNDVFAGRQPHESRLRAFRQWLILAMRTLAIAGLIFAIARPLASGLLGMTGGGKVDTTLVLLDRSPSMQQQGAGGQSKLDTGRRQLADALQTLGSTHWVTIDANSNQAQAFESLAGLMDSPAMQASSATTDLPSMLQAALDYLETNKPGPTEIWLCSDLRESDWNADSGLWSVVPRGLNAYHSRFAFICWPIHRNRRRISPSVFRGTTRAA